MIGLVLYFPVVSKPSQLYLLGLIHDNHQLESLGEGQKKVMISSIRLG